MQIIICDTNFIRLGMIETASVIWCSRYYKCGDFEIHASTDQYNINLLQKDYYVIRDDDDYTGIIENIEMNMDEEKGEFITVKGRFVESLLARRIVWNQTRLSGTLENGLINLLTDNIINPFDISRKISIIGVKAPKGYKERLEAQYTGTDLLKVCEDVCQSNLMGFKMILQNNMFLFEVYKGIDRSYNQAENPRIIFSSEYDNLVSTSYKEVGENEKNIALVAGEGEGTFRRKEVVGNVSGLNRKEMFVDARNISSNNGDVTDAEYKQALIEKGYEELGKSIITKAFDGDVDISQNYKYKRDYFLGDIVSIENVKWRMSMNTRIIEILESEDENGYSITPTFGA